MKTVFNRVLSLVMCLILICSTVSAMAFGVSAEEPFSYKTYAQNATKENIHHLLDYVDDVLKKENINETIDLKLFEININLTSIDEACKTLDKFRGYIDIGKYMLGDLKDLNLKGFDKEMSRVKSGDYKLFCEFLELAQANIGIIEKFISGTLDLGDLAGAAGIDLSSVKIDETIKKGVVDALFDEGDANYSAAKSRALTDFDSFVYSDVMSLVSKEGGILEGISVNEKTTVDHLITDVFNIIVSKHLVGLVKELSFSFADLGSEYAKLDTIVQIDGSYDFSAIAFTKNETVLKQINNVLGEIVKQIVPGYNGWVKGDYNKIGDNMRALVKYIASNSGLIDIKGKSDEALMLEIIKIFFLAADTDGEKEVYEAVKDATTLKDMANKLVIHLSGREYPAGTTYEHVIGDYVIEKTGGTVPLYDNAGKELTIGSQKTVWEVFNSIFNFFLVDKNLDSYFGWNLSKGSTFFEKLDIILDYTADDGSANFNSKTYLNELMNSIFTVNLQKFVELTAVKALNFAGKESVVSFLYKTAYNLLNNWSESTTALKYYSSKPFNNALSGAGLANIVTVFIETLHARSEGTAWFAGVAFGAVENVTENITEAGRTPDCTSNGYAPTKKCTRAECNNIVFSDKNDVIASRGHKYNAGVITTAPKCTVKGVKTYTCTVCSGTRTEAVAAAGHKQSGYKTTKAATYKTKGEQVNTCTVCKIKLGTRQLNMLTLSKPTGLKATAVSTTSIKYSWNAVKGAESYTVYYKTNTGSWKSTTVKGTSVTVKKLKAGLTYKFKVVAVAGSNKSKESATVNSTTKPVAVTFKRAVSKAKKEIVVEWKKISGVTGYEVQHATDKKFKKNKKTVTVKKDKSVKTIIKKLKSKKTYYVRVRAYKTVNNVKVYGAYSKVKSVKCK